VAVLSHVSAFPLNSIENDEHLHEGYSRITMQWKGFCIIITSEIVGGTYEE